MEDIEEEVWKDIEGEVGLYQVSSWGRVKSLDRYVKFNKRNCKEPVITFKVGTLLRQAMTGIKKNYPYVNFHGKPTTVHRLVAKAFVDNPDNHPVVNHIDANPSNNHYKKFRVVY